MRRISVLSGVALAALIAAQSCPHPTPTTDVSAGPALIGDQANANRMQAGVDKLRNGDSAGARMIFQSAADDPQFAESPASVRYGVLSLLAVAQFSSGDEAAAYETLLRAGVVAPEARDGDYWVMLGGVAGDLGKNEAAVEAMTKAVPAGEVFASLDVRLIYQLLNSAKNFDDGGARHKAFLEALWAASYRPEDVFRSAEGMWVQLFEIYADNAEDEKAHALLAMIDEPRLLIGLRSDRRFARFVAADPKHFDVAGAVDRESARDRTLADAHPDSILGQHLMAQNLMLANHLEQALAILDKAIARIEAAPPNEPAFSDLNEHGNWIYDTRARILFKMGRWDDAVAAQIKARDVALAQDNDTVSQTINLGDFNYELGRPTEALAAVAAFGEGSSPYGIMEADEVKVCAYFQLGDKTRMATTLDYMRAHADDGYEPLASALECVGDIDGLAMLLIGQLDNPQTRSSALIDVQTYLPAPHSTDVLRSAAATFAAVLARSDVKAAIAKYGVIESYPLFRLGN